MTAHWLTQWQCWRRAHPLRVHLGLILLLKLAALIPHMIWVR